jgi:hypothetical protein
MHVLTLPRALRRHDGEETETWLPVAATTAESGEQVDDAVAARRRLERRVDSVGLASVAELALVFYGFVFASIAGGVLIVWTAISSFGYVHRFENFMRSIGFRGFTMSTGDVVFGLIAVAGTLILLATILTLLAACAYNVVGATGHGLVLRISEPIALDPRPEPLTEEHAEDQSDRPTPDEASHAA